MEGVIGFNSVTFITSILYVIFINFRVGLAIQGKGEGGQGVLFLLLYAGILIHHMHMVLMCAALHKRCTYFQF